MEMTMRQKKRRLAWFLGPCKQCGHQISNFASKCPKCGRSPKRIRAQTLASLVLGAVLVFEIWQLSVLSNRVSEVQRLMDQIFPGTHCSKLYEATKPWYLKWL